MSDPNQEFQAPPPPTIEGEPERKRPVNLLWAGVALVILGILVLVGGIVGFVPGGLGTGSAVCALGVLFFGLSFTSLPNVPNAPAPMSTVGKLTGIFFEPTSVFRNLRAHPKWLAAILIMGCLNAAYGAAFFYRLTPERVINYTFDKLADSPLKPPPDRMEIAKQQALDAAKLPLARAGNAIKTIVGSFFAVAFIAALLLLGVLAFGGRMHFWQAYAVTAYAALPVLILQKVISFIILFVKSPDDIHPILGQETLVTDNLGILFKSGEHPVLWAGATAIGVLSFYRLWLTATGLREGGYKVSSSAGWGVAITLWTLGLLLGLASAAVFGSFLS